MSFRINIWEVFFGGRHKNSDADSFAEPILSDVQIEEKILNVLVKKSDFPNVLEKDRFTDDMRRFKRILKSVGIVGGKSALRYLMRLKMRGNRYAIQDKLFAVQNNGQNDVEAGVLVWYDRFKSVVSEIEMSGFSSFTKEEIFHSGVAYDMLMVMYVASLACISGYINVVDYNCYTEYALNYCNNIFPTHEACYKSYLVGKFFSLVNSASFSPTLEHFAHVVQNG